MPMAPAGYGDRVEGIHAVEAALAAGRVLELIVENRRAPATELGRLVAQAEQQGLVLRRVDDVRRLATTTAPQGIVAVCRPISPVTLEELVFGQEPAALVLVDHIEDPHNLGAIVRSAVAAGIPALVVPDRRVAPLGAAAFKAAAGALERCSVAVVSSVAETVRRLGEWGVWTVGLDAGATTSVFGLELLARPVGLVIGGETGLHRLVRARVDMVAGIPMAGPVDSLNASVAAGLACFEVMRMRSGPALLA